MAWWGKLVGGAFGFMLGGPLGAALGAVLGHSFDKGVAGLDHAPDPGERERVQTAFFTATFSVMGHLAKADGRVSNDEIALAEAVMGEMDLPAELRKTAIGLFNQGKAPGFPVDEVLEQFRVECHRRQTLIQMFLEIQIQAAYADGALDRTEDQLLQHICGRLGIPLETYRRIEQMVRAERRFAGGGGRGPRAEPTRGPTIHDAYAVLSLAPDASEAEIKRAYRRLMSQHHPDKLVAKGLPEEMMKLAAQKTHEIRQAYEKVRSTRGF